MSEFAPEADVTEQRADALPEEEVPGSADDVPAGDVPAEADEADAGEQRLAVPPGDDDYR